MDRADEQERVPAPAAPGGAYVPFPSLKGWVPPFDEGTFGRYEELLAQLKADASDEALTAAVETAARYAAVDTGAIEGLYEVDRGFTRTVAVEAAAWEVAANARGEHVRRAIEDALKAYEYVLDAATTAAPITESWIRQLHEVICRSQKTYRVYTAAGPQEQPLIKGKYKTQPNSPTNVSTGGCTITRPSPT